jgi:hypothetical protein
MSIGTKFAKTTIPFGPFNFEHTVVEQLMPLDVRATEPRRHSWELTATFAGRAASLQIEKWPSLSITHEFVRRSVAQPGVIK